MPVVINGTTGISGVDGSAGTPAVQGTDTNTGVFFPAADTIAFSEGGTEVARFDSSGNLGIGTSSPSNFGGVNLQVQNSNIGSILWSNGTITGQLLASGSAEVTVGSRSNHPLRFGTNDTERARIDTNGQMRTTNGAGTVSLAYDARAWVNFNGTGTVSIRASGNVSSITDNGTGDYTVNFANAMPDTNYATHINVKELDNTNATTLQGQFMGQTVANTFGTTFARVATFGVGGARFDCVVVNVTVFR